MTTQQIVNDLILDNQNLVIEELMKHDKCLWDELENFDEVSYALRYLISIRVCGIASFIVVKVLPQPSVR